MQTIEKVLWGMSAMAGIIGVVWILIPTIQESNRLGKITQYDVQNYIEGSQEICLNVEDIQIIKNGRHINYNNPTLLDRYGKTKSTLLFKDKKSEKYYLIELYYKSNSVIAHNRFKDYLYLVINKKESQEQGSEENPIVALRYYTDNESPAYDVNDANYKENVEKYLTYKGVVPTSKKTECIVAVLGFFLVIGAVVYTYIMKKKGLQ